MRSWKVDGFLTLVAMAFIVNHVHLLVAAPPAVTASAQFSLTRPPEILRTSLHGLEAGKTSLLVVFGTDLLPNPRLIGLPVGSQVLRAGATAERLEFEVTIPAGAAIGHYPLRIQTAHGISRALPLAVDGLSQVIDGQSDPQHPLTLPIAISGEVPAGRPIQAFISGKGGQRIVIDVECRRLGGTLNPVLELKNSRRTPLGIQWSQAELQGDARLVAELPTDGVYVVELHDLAFKASGSNPFRLKIGELKLADGVFPAVLPVGTRREVKLIGPGWEGSPPITADTGNLISGMTRAVVIPAAPGVAAPAPIIAAGEGIEVIERGSSDAPQHVNCLFAMEPKLSVSINGRIAQPGETDKYLLDVQPEQKLRLRIDSRRVHSRLDSQLIVSQSDGRVIAQSEENSDLTFVVPTGIKSLLVAVRDLHGLGGGDFPYRLEIAPADQPGFTLTLREDRVLLPRDGLANVRLDIDRHGYAGPIAISAEGASQLEVQPSEIPAGRSSAFLQLKVRAGSREQGGQSVRITGESRGLTTPIRRVATVQSGQRLSLATDARYDLPVAMLPASGFSLSLQSVPKTWYRGPPAEVLLNIEAEKLPAGVRAVAFSLVSNEPPRQRSVSGTFPFVRTINTKPLLIRTKVGNREQPLTTAAVHLQVPEEGRDRDFDCTIRADLLADTNDLRPLATTFTRSFHVSVPAAATVKYGSNAIVLASGGPAKFTGQILRHPDFKETIEASLTGLAADYLAPKVTIPPDQDHFEIIITSPKVTAGGEILSVKFVLKDIKGRRLQPDLLMPTRIEVRK